MNILQINASYKPALIYGGPTMSVSELSEQLVNVGANVQVYTTTANGLVDLDKSFGLAMMVDGVLVSYFKRLTKDHTHFSPALLKSLWKNVKDFDIVHIHAWWNLVSVLSCLIAIRRGIPVILSPRGTLSAYSFQNRNERKKYFIQQLLGISLLKNTYIHTTSNNEAVRIKNKFKTNTVYILPNFVRLEKVNPLTRQRNDECLRLIFLSRIEEKKGLDLLILSLRDIPIHYTLTIAGTGAPEYIADLKNLAAENHVSDRIDWIGFQNTSKFQVLQQHDLLVLPSHDENFGNVVIESLSVGTAVLVSDKVGLSDYVTENNFGWICEANTGSVRANILKVSQDKGHLQLIRSIAPNKILKDFDEKNLIKRYIDMYDQIITTI